MNNEQQITIHTSLQHTIRDPESPSLVLRQKGILHNEEK